MSSETHIFIAVDYYRRNILLAADSEAQLTQQILTWYGTHNHIEYGMWKYRVERETYYQIVQDMKEKEAMFYEVAQPKRTSTE